MRKILLLCVLTLLAAGMTAQVSICGGSTVVLQAQNPHNLANPSYSLSPGGAVSPTGSFQISPPVTTTYTMHTSGLTSTSTFTTTDSVVTVVVNPQPQIAPTVTNFACGTYTNAWNLNLVFTPTNVPTYTVTWGPPPPPAAQVPLFPPKWTGNATSQQDTIAPGSYTPIIITADGCTATAVFSLTPPKAPAVFTLSPAGGPNYSLGCTSPTMNICASEPSLTYTFNSLTTGVLTSSCVSVTYSNAGTWTVAAMHPTSFCTSSQTFAVIAATQAPLSSIGGPTFQSITCANPGIVTLTLTAINPTVNFTQYVYSPMNSTFVTNVSPAVYQPGTGTYTYVVLNNITGCTAVKNFTVTNPSNDIPTFQLQSSAGQFTLGCSTRSCLVVSFINANTNPPPGGGSISFTLIAPGASSALPSGTLGIPNTYTVCAPGTWTAVTRDNLNQCDNRTPFSVTTQTLGPTIDSVVVPTQVLNCTVQQTTLQVFSKTNNVGYSWLKNGSGGVISQAGTNLTVQVNPLSTSTVIDTYTMVIQDNSSKCTSSTIIPIYQNLYKPIPRIIGNGTLTCGTPTVQLSHASSSGIPPTSTFPTGSLVIAILWQGPTPQLDLQNSSSYVAFTPGFYTVTVQDLNNGCTSGTTALVGDGFNYPVVNAAPNIPKPQAIDCAKSSTVLTATVTGGSGVSYSWTAPPGIPTGQTSLAALSVSVPGVYTVMVTDVVSKCVTTTTMSAYIDSLTVDIDASKVTGFAPLSVDFSNNSTSASGNSSISTVWSFGNGTTLTTVAASIAPTNIYTEPGTYTAVAFARQGACTGTTSLIINVEIPSALKVPNVFTPNGDGVNDLYFLQRSANLSEITATFYDRWGNIVYEVTSTKGNIEWDGMNQYGKECPTGTYYYIITAKGTDKKSFEEKGTLTLLR